MAGFEERFQGEALDRERWLAAYLPAWSSRAEAAATYELTGDGLRLSIPPDQPLWCADLHQQPLRVSAVQSGNWSGPVGSPRGQQPFRDGLLVREEQPRMAGLVPRYGRVEVECRAAIGPGSMFSAWMIGMEEEPHQCGEICLVEVFGETVQAQDGRVGADVGAGIHAFRDPALAEEFAAPRRELDVAHWHRYAVDWTPEGVRWLVDGVETARSTQSPDYPMLLILGVFDFPGRSDPAAVPELVVRRVAWTPL
ncbi:glycoside hydrolase family 16 protein [Nocardioides sp. SYSU DS0651]|uniref:glycoside hydrolase family 16 protein n=1 Tax=Nocardioides sp. SYSU DS0651 TaxID=3415955 RepID=UPI003F4C1949